MTEQTARKMPAGREEGDHSGTPPPPPSKPASLDSEREGSITDGMEVVSSRLGRALKKRKARKASEEEGAKF